MKNRNIALSVVFSFISFGIYALYWLAQMQNAFKEKGCDEGFGGAGTVICSMFVPFYFLYWNYKAGKRAVASNISSEDRSVIYLVLSFVGLGIVNLALIQTDINKQVS